MAFVDVNPYTSAQQGGAPQGGGIAYNPGQGGAIPGTPPGMHGPGGSGAVHHWILAFYAIIGIVLIGTGVLFNGKGKSV